MRKIAFLLVVILCVSFASAQDASKGSVFGGYQLLNFDSVGDRQNLHGWDFDAAINATKNISLVGDVGGNYKSVDAGSLGTLKARVYTLMAGPRFSANLGQATPFFQTTAGLAHATGEVLGQGESTNKFAFSFGGGLDVNVAKNIAVRVGKFDYFLIRSGEEGIGNLNNLRYSAGVVFKF